MVKNKKFSVGGLFAGVGGIERGFEKAGFEISWANEIDKYACKTYRLNHPNHKLIEKDIYELNPKKLESVDVLAGGFPCQAFSVAGYRKGFEDPRGNLFYEIARFIDELKTKPKALMLENVKNLSGHDKGRTRNEIVRILREFGYSVIWDVYNTAEYTSLPQNRERTIIVCFRNEADWEFDLKSRKKGEKLFRKDHKYDAFIPINYNTNPVIPHRGSVIFLHLTQNYEPTAGCIAVSIKNFLILVKYIKPTDKIKIG